MTRAVTPASRRPGRPRRLAAVAAAVVAATLGLGACGAAGAADALVGLRPAPAERPASAPLDPQSATAIATRVLTAARAPAEGGAAAQKAARARVLTGDALTLAEARATRPAAPEPDAALATGPRPRVVAQSQGRAWPRAILASTLDADGTTQFLHVLMSEKPEQPFRIAASVPMFAGAELPAIGTGTAGGAPLLRADGRQGLAASPEDAVTAYAAALAYPKPRPTRVVGAGDPFARALRAATTAQAKALGKLATVTQAHAPQLEHALTFELADGGAVTFTLLRRTDTIAVRPAAKELVLPTAYAALVGKKKVTRSLTLASLEAVAVVVPEKGAAEVIGASELLVSGKAR